MKYLKLLCCLLLIIPAFVKAQFKETEKFVDNSLLKEGTIVADVFYGWPYFNGVLLRSLNGNNNNQNLRNTNHIGFKVEYMINKNVGLGGEFTYADAAIKYASSNVNGPVVYEAGITKIRVLGRLNYHFATTKNLDPYCTLGIGYKQTRFYDTGNSNYNEVYNLLPVSSRVGIGLRYYFNELLGINFETGLGGPLVLFGISAKL